MQLVFDAVLAGYASDMFVFIQIFPDISFHILACVNRSDISDRGLWESLRLVSNIGWNSSRLFVGLDFLRHLGTHLPVYSSMLFWLVLKSKLCLSTVFATDSICKCLHLDLFFSGVFTMSIRCINGSIWIPSKNQLDWYVSLTNVFVFRH